MANKRFFWLKLHEDFFQQKAMKKLRRMDHGEVLTIIYLKMQLASLRNGGAIAFEGMDGSLAEELAYQIDEPEQDVETTINFLMRFGLMEQVDGADMYILPCAVANTGSESDSAARMRALRERQASQCDGSASLCSDIKRESREKQIQSHIQKGEGDVAAEPPAPTRDSRDLIFLDDAQYSALVADLGEREVKRCIDYLSEYCSMHNKKYGDWDAAIRKCSREQWGIKPSGTPGDFQPSADRIKENNDWLDKFLAEQQKKNGVKDWGAKTTKL